MFRILFPGQKVPPWIPSRVVFSYPAEEHGQGRTIGCFVLAWRRGKVTKLRNIFGGSMFIIETGGAEVDLPYTENLVVASRPLIPLLYGAAIEVCRHGETVQWIGHTDDLKEV